jgi:pimeloyl-ACP methyl ester carboxylesterase
MNTLSSTTVMSQNVQTYVAQAGAGSPILFLHGAPDSSAMWNGLIGQLSDNYHCIALDLPGFGQSVAPANFDYSLENRARWVEGVVNALGITEPVSLVMHDFGGHFGLAWAIRHPNRVRRLVISNTNFFSDYKWHSGAQFLRTPLLGEFGMWATNYQSLSQMLRSGSPTLTEDHIRETYARFTPSVRRAMLKLYRASDSKNFIGWEDELLKLTKQIPTLVVWGDLDPFAAATIAERFGAQTVHHFANYGHWVPVEGAAAVAEEMTKFL